MSERRKRKSRKTLILRDLSLIGSGLSLSASGTSRRERDSNPRYSCPYTAFRVRPDRPLRHLSEKNMSLKLSFRECKYRHNFYFCASSDRKKCENAKNTLRHPTDRTIIRIFNFVENTPARQSANKFGITLAYSYLWLRRRYSRLNKIQTSLVLFSAYSYL